MIFEIVLLISNPISSERFMNWYDSGYVCVFLDGQKNVAGKLAIDNNHLFLSKDLSFWTPNVNCVKLKRFSQILWHKLNHFLEFYVRFMNWAKISIKYYVEYVWKLRRIRSTWLENFVNSIVGLLIQWILFLQKKHNHFIFSWIKRIDFPGNFALFLA